MRKIVSVTSFGARLNSILPIALRSVTDQVDFKPDKIMVYLAEDDYASLNKNAFNKIRNVEFKVVPDYMSYKKYYALTEREYDNDLVWVVDDDLNMRPNTWKLFENAYNKERTDIIYSSDLYFIKDNKQHLIQKSEDAYMSYYWGMCNFFLPQTARFEESVLRDGFNLLPTWDDAFLSVYFYNKEVRFQNINNVKEIASRPLFNNYQLINHPTGALSLGKINKKTFKGSLKKALDYFGYPSERIVVSLGMDASSKQIYDKVVSIFNQKLIPDEVILTVKSDFKPTKKLQGLVDEYCFDIQYADDPMLKKWNPDNVDDDSLLVVTDGSFEFDKDTVLKLYSKYNNKAITADNTLVYVKGYGHHYAVSDKCTVVKRKSLRGIEAVDDLDITEVTRVVLSNHTSVEPICFIY